MIDGIQGVVLTFLSVLLVPGALLVEAMSSSTFGPSVTLGEVPTYIEIYLYTTARTTARSVARS